MTNVGLIMFVEKLGEQPIEMQAAITNFLKETEKKYDEANECVEDDAFYSRIDAKWHQINEESATLIVADRIFGYSRKIMDGCQGTSVDFSVILNGESADIGDVTRLKKQILKKYGRDFKYYFGKGDNDNDES